MRIQNLEEGSLAKVIYQEAEDLGWPGLGREVRQICKVINIPDLNRHRMMKKEVQQAIRVSQVSLNHQGSSRISRKVTLLVCNPISMTRTWKIQG